MENNLSPKMLDALDLLRAHGAVSYTVERVAMSTWKALVRRDLVEMYMDADRTYIRNLRLAVAGMEATNAPR